MNQEYPIQTSEFNSCNMDFCINITSLQGSTVITMTRIYAGRSGIDILAEVFPTFTIVQLFCSQTEIDTINDGAQYSIFIKCI